MGDNADAFPNDSSETADRDGDGVGDNADVFPNIPENRASVIASVMTTMNVTKRMISGERYKNRQ